MSEAKSPPYDYLRVRIEIRLRLQSPLHCGNGEEMPAKHWDQTLGEKGHINTVCTGHFGAYIPASTLRGSLRDRCGAPSRLFGEARGASGCSGALRVYDAVRLEPDPSRPDANILSPKGDHYWHSARRTTLRDGVALDPVTGTAEDGKLFTFEVLPTDQVFLCVFEADRITKEDLVELAELIAGWDGSATTAIGRGRSRGWGRVLINGEAKITALTDQLLMDWVKISPKGLPQFDELPTPIVASRSHHPELHFCLSSDGPLLINDAGRVHGRDNSKAKDPMPHLEFMRTANGAALIPGSSLRGALRAHSGRILATIAHQQHGHPVSSARKLVEPLLSKVFGTERQRSLLWVDDVVATQTTEHRQTFSAIDRFTGAVAQETQKIYLVAAADCPILNGTVTLDLAEQRIPEGNWWKGVLLLLLRDCYEGDLIVGWGKSRGYGAVRLMIDSSPGKEAVADFNGVMAAVRKAYGNNAPNLWLTELHTAVGSLVTAKKGGDLA